LVYCYEYTDDQEPPNTYLKCESTAPTMVDNYEVFINNESKFPVSSGSSVTLDAKLIVCTSEKCSVPEKSGSDFIFGKKVLDANNYFINHQKEEVESLIKCDSISGTCNSIEKPTLTEGFYINGIEDLSLIKCSEQTKQNDEGQDESYIVCETMNNVIKYGHYNSHDNSKYIECNNENCSEKSAVDGYTFINSDADSEKFIITCTTSCSEVKAGGYYLDSSLGERNLLNCNESGCIKVEGVSRGVYISDNGKKLISCDITQCQVMTTTPILNAEKLAYYLNGDTSAENPIITSVKGEDEESTARKKRDTTYKWAPMTEKPTTNDIFINGNVNADGSYGLIYCTSDNSCTEISDTSNGKYYIDINNGKIIECTASNCDDENPNGTSKLPTGKESGTTYNFVINKSNAQLITSGSGTLALCTFDSENKWSCEYKSGESTYYKDNFNTNTLLVGSGTTYTIKTASDMRENGYFINNNDDVYECDGSNSCVKTTIIDDCTSGTNGSMTKIGNICLAYNSANPDNTIHQPKDSNKLFIFTTNSFPGVTGPKVIMINAAGDKVVQVKPSSDVYYLIGDELSPVTSSSEVGTVYKCSSNGDCSQLKPTSTTYYPNSDESTIKNFSNIKCEKVIDEDKTTDISKPVYKADLECTLSKKSGDEVYCLKTGSSKLNSCVTNCNGICYEITHKAGYYLPYEKSYLISCTTSGCSEYKSLAEGYYKSEDAANTLIHCNKSGDGYRCEYETLISNGYYVGASKNLIKCSSGVCVVKNDSNEGWFVSAEYGKALTYCTGTGTNFSCSTDSKPAVGYYKNGGDDNPLILCTAVTNGNVSCSEIALPNKGHFINASNKEKYLIDCSTGTCTFDDAISGYYYINGVNKKLIYCSSSSSCLETEGKGWFIGDVITSITPIYCDGTCSIKSPNELRKGYYLNADPFINKSYPLLQNTGTSFKYKVNVFTGWAINAGSTSNNDKILECVNGIIPYCLEKSVVSDCSNGKFFDDAGKIKWCINNKEVNLLVAGESSRYVYANISSKNLFSWISDSSGYVKFEIGENYIKQIVIDGYSYDEENDVLYLCNGFGSGICKELKLSDITPGYYINYSDNAIIICGKYKDSLCINVTKDVLKGSDVYTKYDIVIGTDISKPTYDKLYLYPASTDTDPVIMSNINSETLYALANEKSSKSFPKPEDVSYARYILVDVNKYYIKYRENIDEVSECLENESNSDETDDKKVCLSNEKLVYIKSNKELGYSSTTTIIPVNNNYINTPIEYDADTNNGYFEYVGDGINKNVLKKVYIKKVDNNRVEFKYECPINGICVRREKAKEPVLGYQFENGIMKKQVRNENSSEILDEKIMPGVYIKYDGVNTNLKEVIYCHYDNDYNVVCENMSRSNSGITYNGKEITADSVTSSKLFTKLVKKRVIRNFKRGLLEKRDDSNVLILKELTSTSYSEATFNDVTNIFLNSEYKKITNEVLTKLEETKVTGYTCNQNGECIEIKKGGNKKYFLNTAQTGKLKNAIVVCGNIESSDVNGRCRFIDATNESIYENYAASSPEDALIICSISNGCKTAPAVNSGSLPSCQLNVANGIALDDSTKSCIRADNLKPLLDGQHCVLNGEIYVYEEGQECHSITGYENNGGMKLFDVTYRKVIIPKIEENHYGAILYNCPRSNGGCYVTYGYIASNTNTVTNYSICNKNGCLYNSELDRLKDNCAEAGEGSLIYANKYIKLCKTNDSVNTVGYHPVAISINENFPGTVFGDHILVNIEVVNSVSIYSLVLNDGYILLDSSNKIVNENSSNKGPIEISKASIYFCSSTNRSCTIVSNPEFGYFKSSLYNSDLITVDLSNKNVKQASVTSYNNIFKVGTSNEYISFTGSNDESKYYPINENFPGYNYGVIAEARKYSIIPLKADNYVLVNKYENRLASKTETRDMKNLYLCNSSVGKCVASEIEDGWYVSGQNGYEAIICEKGSCSMKETISRSCNGEGDFIISDNSYNICILKDKTISKFKLSENVGKVSELTSSKIIFPNNKSYIVVNSNSVKGIGYRDVESGTTPSGITQCKSYNSSTGICLKSNGKVLEGDEYCLLGNKIYANTTESGVSSCSQKFTSGVSVEMFYGSTLVKSSTKNTIYGAQLFYCKNGECRLTSGYKKINTFFRCSYGLCEKKTTTGSENGDLENSQLRTSDGKQAFAKDKYFYISGNNHFPGAENYKSFIIEMGDTYAVPFIGNGYYLISNKYTLLSKDPKEEGYVSEKTGNKLYFCNNVDNNCFNINNQSGNLVENIFYKNAASSNPNTKAIIGCYNNGDYSTNCVIAEDDQIIFDESINTCDLAGKLVRTTSAPNENGIITYGEYKLCNARKSAPISTNVSTSKYYMINLSRNDAFAAVAVKDDAEYENIKRNIIVEVGNGYISQFEKEGYILFNPTTNEIIETVGNNRGTLYNCKRSENYKDAKRYSYTCDLVTNIGNGWYFNEIYGDKRVIRCIDNACSIIEVNESDKCINSGSLIYNNGFKLCQTTNKQIDISNVSEDFNIVMKVSLLNEFPGMKSNNTEILLSINSRSVYQVKMKTNVVVNDDNTVISKSEGSLYECYLDGHCDLNSIPNNNYYLKSNSNGKDTELIKCNERKCIVVSNELGNELGNREGFRVSSNIKSPLIQCVKPGSLNEEGHFIASDIAECKEKEFKEGWYLNSGSDSSTKPLIECTKEFGCITKSIDSEGWYLNAGANSVFSKIGGYYYPVIRCENNSCEYITEEFEKECTKGGLVIMPSNGNYKLCKEESKSIDFNKSNNIEIISLEGSKIPVVTYSTKIVNAGDGYYYKDNVMYECNGTCTELNGDDKNGIYVYDKILSILMIASCSDGTCTWSNIRNEGNYFIDDSKYLVTNKATGVNEIYECLKNSSTKNIICEEVLENNSRGYYFNSEIKDQDGKQETLLYLCESRDCEVQEDIPKCTELSYRNNYCYISYPNEMYTEEYEGKEPIIDGGSICINESNKYYFAINEINTGIDNSNCVSIPIDTSNYYYSVKNGSGVTTVYLQNKYSTRRISTGSSVINGMNTNSVISIKDSNNALLLEDNYNYVSCINQKCELNKLISCTYNFQTGKCSVLSGSVNPGQLCISSEKRLYFALEKLTSSGGKCVNHQTGWSYSLGSNSVSPDYSTGLYSSIEKNEDIWFVVDGNMYKIQNDNDIYLQEEGVYLIDSSNKRVDIVNNVDISKESQFKLYICNDSGCKVKNSCNNGNNYEYIYNTGNGKIIQCDPKTNTVNYINGHGYYLNTPWEDVVKCTNGVCIEYNSDIGMEGYYYDSGNNEKIIKCTRNGSIFKCINEDIIPCTYNAKSKTCGSTVDLKRNSYCVYINKVKGKIIGNPIMLYIQDFIKANDEGKCIENEGTEEFYYHYRKSKFLGNNERDEIIKYSKGSIVSLYEKDIGYYIITTNTRKGINVNTNLNQSRMYVCTSNGCVEQRNPENDRIYINKASEEKMVRYHGNGKYWEVMKRHCIKSTYNVRQCELPSNGIRNGDVIYMFEDGDLNPEFITSKVDLTTKSTLIKENNDVVDSTKYQYFKTDGKMYLLNPNKQSFDPVNESGYYMFENSNYYHNLIPYKSTVNTTDTSKIQIYSYNNQWSESGTFSFEKFNDGYYWNKADLNEEGIVLQVMNVPMKKENEDENNLRKREEENESVNKYKAIINKCISTKKGVCVSAQDGKNLAKGDVCVVVNGDYRGLYLAIDNITKSSSNNNCIRYDTEDGYFYVGGKYEFAGEPLKKSVVNAIEFAGQPLVKTIINVKQNSINAFTENNSFGYYVIEKSEKKKLSSTTSIDATGYYCGWEYDPITEGDNAGENNLETIRFECNPVKASNKYIYTISRDVVYAKSDSKWNVENKRGYYFFNEKFEAAVVKMDENNKNLADSILYSSGNVSRPGTYINSAANTAVVVENNSSNKKTILTDYKLCQVTGETCKPVDTTVELSNGEVCYASNKSNSLYLVLVTEVENVGKKYNCYTGSEKIKYRYVNNMLYKLDGLSVQEVTKGYYILNKNWEEFSATYPEVPPYVFNCDGTKCDVVSEKIEINSDVIVNAAGNGNNKLLKYYPASMKFVNVSKPGYYMLNGNSEVTKISGSYDYTHNYYLDENGNLSGLPGSFKYSNIYINNAKEGSLTRYYSEFENIKVALNTKTGYIEYDGKTIDEEETKYIYIDNILYKQKLDHFEEVDNGLYAIKNNAAFVSTEWTSLSSGNEICYYTGGYCDVTKLNNIKKQQYTLNYATDKPSVIEYDSYSGNWRMVDEDGVYFFFEDEYSITSTDRRIDRVFEVLEGEAVEITNDQNRIGYYKFNNLIIESNENKWEDAVISINTVVVENKRICQSYETDEIINSSKLCHDDVLGICIPKLDIENRSDSNNCIFSDSRKIYYFLIGDNLYSVNDQSFRIIKKSGLYVVNSSKKIFEDKLETKATAYSCEEGKCKIENELSTGYYLNMANSGIDEPAILYYNQSNKTWRKTTDNDLYLFNEKGYMVSNSEEITFAYRVEENGNKIYSVVDNNENGIFINHSSGDEKIIVEFNKAWGKAKKVPSCKIDNGKVTSNEVMKVGDVCIDDKKMVVISGTNENKKRDSEYSYDGITAEGEEVKYTFNPEDNSVLKLEDGHMMKLNINGYIITDKETSKMFDSYDLAEAEIYKCDSGKCSIVEVNSFTNNSHVINSINSENPLLRYEDGKWMIETEEGYYFFKSDSNVVGNGDIVSSAIEIELDANGNSVQRDITSSNELGFYFNKASSENILVSNEKTFWSKGSTFHKCNITMSEEGNICRTMKETLVEVLNEGDYCYDGEKLFLLTAEANSEVTEFNCITGSNEEPLYVTPEKISTINNLDVGTKLIRLTDESIKVVSPGIYIINENGTIIDNNGEEGQIEMQIYICNEDECEQETNMEKNVKFLTESGEIFEINENNLLTKVATEGIYFFREDGIACTGEEDNIGKILKLSVVEEELIKTEIELDELSVGVYVNSANTKSVGIYDGDQWKIEEVDCKYNTEKKGCTSDSLSMEVGSYCVVDGNLYIVNNIDEEAEINACVPGKDENPLYFMNSNSELMIIKEKSISIIDDDGYYAINDSTKEALKSDAPTVSKFYKCDVGFECNEIKPEKSSSYLNKAIEYGNIVKFNEKGSLKEAVTMETHCTVSNNSCSLEEGELAAGDICIADNSLYLVKDDKNCVMAEKYVERYQFVNNKLYKLVADTVIQKYDGYYFIDGDSRAIMNIDDYKNPDTIGYMCSVKGDCYEIVPTIERYYKDYTTVKDGKFKVIKYDPSKRDKREESSGYGIITEGGIYKLDDGSYAECEIESNDEVSCKDIEDIGTKVTVDHEVVLCTKENKTVECVQATEGGYYLIDDVLMECLVDEEGSHLKCDEVMKEGYFLADGKDALYECVEKVEEEDLGISSITNELNGYEDLEEMDSRRREEGDEEEKSVSTRNSITVTDEPTATPTETIEEPKGPVEVNCKVIECNEGTIINSGGENSVDLYICKLVENNEEKEIENENEATDEEKEEDEDEEISKYQWVSKDCESGNYLKKNDSYYECEDKKDSIKEEYIEKPNNDKTSTEPKTTVARTTKTTTTEEIPTSTTESATTNTTSNEQKSTTTKPKTTSSSTTSIITTTTTKTTTTKTTTTAATTTAGSGTSLRSIPSYSLFIVLFIFILFMHY